MKNLCEEILNVFLSFQAPESLDGEFSRVCAVDVTVERDLFDHGGQVFRECFTSICVRFAL